MKKMTQRQVQYLIRERHKCFISIMKKTTQTDRQYRQTGSVVAEFMILPRASVFN